jgi:hypothetical protein
MSALPPWRVGEWELASDFAKIEQQWAPLRRVLEDPVLFDMRDPDVSGWSCGQHAGHSVLVAQLMADRIEGNLAEPERNRHEATWDVALRVMTAGGFPRGAAESPDDVPPGTHARDDFLTLLDPTIESWVRVRGRAGELPGCIARALHPVLRYLTSTEWVRMCAVHTAHHLALVRDVAGEEAAA